MTGFALGLYVYEMEQSVTLFSLVAFATLMPEIALSAFAGTLIDRWNRRTALIIGNLGAGIGSLLIIFLNIRSITWNDIRNVLWIKLIFKKFFYLLFFRIPI